MYHSILPPPPTYSCTCRFTRDADGTGYYPQPTTVGTTPRPNPPAEVQKALDSLTDCMKEEGLLEPTLEERIKQVEVMVDGLMLAVKELTRPKKSCKGNCKKEKKEKKVLKD
jgi:hypothetical protein